MSFAEVRTFTTKDNNFTVSHIITSKAQKVIWRVMSCELLQTLHCRENYIGVIVRNILIGESTSAFNYIL
jgi:hypothetical protein